MMIERREINGMLNISKHWPLIVVDKRVMQAVIRLSQSRDFSG